ncbi:Erf family protein [Peptoanaerobacter stomatis]|uniref:Erf family protein n=1 Tax=Peptoanaerobacter stomatis TaxID=796937 RepID=J6HBK7_9FIRM|nr:ERF family protein [Peptoanaerobacter stomatis]EJU22515.1 Erf family protein [Peptoanaerobacter stomatis]
MTIYEKLKIIQTKLKAPKGQYNNFGRYNYRSLEDITEAVKPLLDEVGAVLTITDDIVLIGDRFYVKATAYLVGTQKDDGLVSVVAFARESEDKKGMDSSQVTGAASSYARKYALNGLFAIDDTKDTDTEEYQSKEPKDEQKREKTNSAKIVQTQADEIRTLAEIKRVRITDIENKKGKKLEEFTPAEYATIMKYLRGL